MPNNRRAVVFVCVLGVLAILAMSREKGFALSTTEGSPATWVLLSGVPVFALNATPLIYERTSATLAPAWDDVGRDATIDAGGNIHAPPTQEYAVELFITPVEKFSLEIEPIGRLNAAQKVPNTEPPDTYRDWAKRTLLVATLSDGTTSVGIYVNPLRVFEISAEPERSRLRMVLANHLAGVPLVRVVMLKPDTTRSKLASEILYGKAARAFYLETP